MRGLVGVAEGCSGATWQSLASPTYVQGFELSSRGRKPACSWGDLYRGNSGTGSQSGKGQVGCQQRGEGVRKTTLHPEAT